MKDQILSNIGQPATLEKLYRDNPIAFKDNFFHLQEEIKDSPMAAFWNARLQSDSESISWGTINERWFLVIGAILMGLVTKLPSWLALEEDLFFSKNGSFIAFSVLISFFAWKNQLTKKNLLFIIATGLLTLLFINLGPWTAGGDSLIIASLHLPLVVWGLWAWSFIGNNPWDLKKRLDFVRFNGDLIILSTILLLAGGLTVGITVGLFELIGLQIGDFLMQNIILVALPSVPLLATLVIQHNTSLVSKVSPIVAKIFSPLVLGILAIYLFSMLFSAKSIYNDREFLLLFNILLLGVMALIVFSISENTKSYPSKLQILTLATLASVTLIVNGLALHAISLRILEFGWTPNRLAVLGSNILMLIHLLLVAKNLWKAAFQENQPFSVGENLVSYLPVYLIWAVMLIFGMPLLFGF